MFLDKKFSDSYGLKVFQSLTLSSCTGKELSPCNRRADRNQNAYASARSEMLSADAQNKTTMKPQTIQAKPPFKSQTLQKGAKSKERNTRACTATMKHHTAHIRVHTHTHTCKCPTRLMSTSIFQLCAPKLPAEKIWKE